MRIYINIYKELNKECVLEEDGGAREDLHQYLVRIERGMCAGGGRRRP